MAARCDVKHPRDLEGCPRTRGAAPMASTEFAAVRAEPAQAPLDGFPHWTAVRGCAAGPLRRRPRRLDRRLRDPGSARAGDRLDLRRPRLSSRSAGPRGRSSSSPSTGCRSSRCSPSTTSTRGAADSIGIGVHETPMIDFDKFRLLRRDADRMAPGAALRARRRALVRRRLHPRLHLLLHRPVRHRGRALGARPARLPAVRQAPRDARDRGSGDLHRLSPRRRPGWPASRASSTASTGPRRRAGNTSTSAPPGSSPTARARSTRSPPSPPSTPPSSPSSRCSSGAGCGPPCRPLLALYPLAMGLTLMATGEHYFFDVVLGWGYAGLVMLGWSRWERRRAKSAPEPT